MGERAEFKKLRALTDAIRRDPERGLAALRDGAGKEYGRFQVGNAASFFVVTNDHPGMRVDVMLWPSGTFTIGNAWCAITLHIRYARTLPDNVNNTPNNSPLVYSGGRSSERHAQIVYGMVRRMMAGADAGEPVVFVQEFDMRQYRDGNVALAMHLLGKALRALSKLGVVSDATRVVLYYGSAVHYAPDVAHEPDASERAAWASGGFEEIAEGALHTSGMVSTVGRVGQTPKPAEPSSSCALQ